MDRISSCPSTALCTLRRKLKSRIDSAVKNARCQAMLQLFMIPSSELSALRPGTLFRLAWTGSVSTFHSNIWWSLTKSNYDKLSQALSAWYTPDQIEKIWALLKEFDKTLKPSSSQAGGPAHKKPGFKQLRLTSDKLIGYYKRHRSE